VFNAIFSNISAIHVSWRPVLVVEEAGVPGREPQIMGMQLVNFITCGCESSAPFFVIYKAGCEPTQYWWLASCYVTQLPKLLSHAGPQTYLEGWKLMQKQNFIHLNSYFGLLFVKIIWLRIMSIIIFLICRSRKNLSTELLGRKTVYHIRGDNSQWFTNNQRC